MTDSELLNWLEKNDGCALLSDDFGRWAVSSMGMQNVPENPFNQPNDISTSFFILAREWHPSIREAIQAAIDRKNAE